MGYRIFGGFGNGTFSFEIGLSDFGELAFDTDSDGSGGYQQGTLSAKTPATTGVDLGLVGRARISDSLDVIGRIGFWDGILTSR